MISSFQDNVTRVLEQETPRMPTLKESNNLSLFLSIWKTLKPCIGNCRIIAQSPRHSVLEKVVFRSSRPFFLICLFSQSLVVELITELLPSGCFVWLAFFRHFSFLNSVLVMQRLVAATMARRRWPVRSFAATLTGLQFLFQSPAVKIRQNQGGLILIFLLRWSSLVWSQQCNVKVTPFELTKLNVMF